jgi:hypothetical protein
MQAACYLHEDVFSFPVNTLPDCVFLNEFPESYKHFFSGLLFFGIGFRHWKNRATCLFTVLPQAYITRHSFVKGDDEDVVIALFMNDEFTPSLFVKPVCPVASCVEAEQDDYVDVLAIVASGFGNAPQFGFLFT